MNKDVKNVLDNFLQEFKKLPLVQKYILLKNKMKEDEDFLHLKEELKNAQKELALSIGTDLYKDKKDRYQKLEANNNSHPYIVN